MKGLKILSVLGLILLCSDPIVKAQAQESKQERIIPIDESIRQDTYTEGAVSFDHALDHEDSPYFTANDYYNMESGGTLHILPHFKTYQQTTEYSCGCASALMVLEHLGNDDYNEMELCELVQTHPTKGSSVEGLAAFFEETGYMVEAHADTENKFDRITDAETFFVDSIEEGIPVMVDWLDWRGHWQVVIGIDTMNAESVYDDVLILADPYDVTDHMQDGYYIVPFGRFYEMWREGVCAEKEIPYEQPFVRVWEKE